jgi:hypothetical protein
MSGVGNDGVVLNVGRLDSTSDGSSLIAVLGDRSQAINAGLATMNADDLAVLFAVGEDAAAKNVGRIKATGTNIAGIEGVITNTRLSNSGSVRVDGAEGIGMAGFGDGHQLTNTGLIDIRGDSSAGMAANGIEPFGLPGTGLEIRNAGRIVTDGELALGASLGLNHLGFRPAVDGTIVNSGVIEAQGDGSAGVAMIGDGHHLTNSGRITTNGGAVDDELVGPFRAAGVVVSGNGDLVENTHSGVIRSKDAASAGVELNVVEREGFPAADSSSQLQNSGLISAHDIAVLGGAGQETVVNNGRIIGDVSLGEGDDTFVFGKGGTVRGGVALGGGDDLVRVENGSGRSRLADFTAGDASDAVDVSAFYSSFDQVLANARQSGNDVIIKLDRNDSLVLTSVDLSTVTASDFVV